MNDRPEPSVFEYWALVISGWACLIAIGVGVYEWRAAFNERSALNAMLGQEAIARTQLQQLKQLGTAGLNRIIELQVAIAASERQTRHPDSSPADDRVEAGRRFLAAHPEAQKLADRLEKALINSWPTRAARAAGFSDEQISQYAALLARMGGDEPFVVDGISLPRSGDLPPYEVQTTLLRALVGDSLYADYQQALNGPQRTAAHIVEVESETDSPLSPAQSQALQQIFSSFKGPIVWDQATERASSILSPTQIQALHAVGAAQDAVANENKFVNDYITTGLAQKP